MTLDPPLAPFAQLRSPLQLILSNTPTLYALATLCRATYAPTSTQFGQVARAMFGGNVAVTFSPNSSATVPGYGIIVTPSGDAIVAVSGTTNLSQWLDQSVASALVPTMFGLQDNANAVGVYLTAAIAIAAAVNSLVPSENSVMWIGHSMGGAVAAVLAYKAQFDVRPGIQQLVTFAAPKPGDVSLSLDTYTSDLQTVRLMIEGDIVPALPPDPDQFVQAFVATLPTAFQAVLNLWGQYRPINQTPLYLSSDSTRQFGDEPFILAPILTAIIAAAAGQPVPIVTQHRIATFCNYLSAGVGNWANQLSAGWANPTVIDTVNQSLNAMGL